MGNRLLRPAQVTAAFLVVMVRFQSLQGAPVTTEPAEAAVNALGIDLLKKTSKPDANALLSPYSIQSALAMAYAGAGGVTREEMAKVLHYPKDEPPSTFLLAAPTLTVSPRAGERITSPYQKSSTKRF